MPRVDNIALLILNELREKLAEAGKSIKEAREIAPACASANYGNSFRWCNFYTGKTETLDCPYSLQWELLHPPSLTGKPISVKAEYQYFATILLKEYLRSAAVLWVKISGC